MEDLISELKFYEEKLKVSKNQFEKAILEFEIACVKKDLKEYKTFRGTSKEETKNNGIPKELESLYGIEKEDTDSLIAFKESLFEKTAKENIKLKKQVEQLEKEKQKLIEKLEEDIKQYHYMTTIVEVGGYEEGYYKGHISNAQEILKILKGENDEQINSNRRIK